MTTHSHHPRTEITAALLWFLSLLWFLAQFAAQAAWRTPYSLAHNYVSDLGATACGHFPAGSAMYVCSPLHAVMNFSFVTWGAVWAIGSVLFAIGPSLRRSTRAAYLLVGLGGVGTALVGVVPENVNFTVHSLAAALQTFAMTAGLAILGVKALRQGRHTVGVLTLGVAFAAIVGIVATAFAEDSGAFIGVPLGIWERISLWPLPIWLAATGVGRLVALVTAATAPAPLTTAVRVSVSPSGR
ncbi:DUF998 domain-containing protein [Curtobacterium sp. 22159]|uniref:DUF998 domain-containing protein n=1 Tax=Curtobacterium sp. 22159 TaxID=3453882 RepID=UPI003F862C4B